MEEAKTIVQWVGEKRKLIPNFENIIGQSRFDMYVEPFVGGGAMFFNALNKRMADKYVINDLNNKLISLYLDVRDNCYSLKDKIDFLFRKYDSMENEEKEKMFYDKRDEFNDNSTSTEDRSAILVFLNRTCFNGLYRENSKGKLNAPFGKNYGSMPHLNDLIETDSAALKNVNILSGDYMDSTSKYISSKSFFYMDPPYRPISKTSSFNAYQKGGFGDDQQIRLKKFCDAINDGGGKFIVSNSFSSDGFFQQLYSNYRIVEVYAPRAINCDRLKRGKVKEIMITNI